MSPLKQLLTVFSEGMLEGKSNWILMTKRHEVSYSPSWLQLHAAPGATAGLSSSAKYAVEKANRGARQINAQSSEEASGFTREWCALGAKCRLGFARFDRGWIAT
jgi:hypothetical protein